MAASMVGGRKGSLRVNAWATHTFALFRRRSSDFCDVRITAVFVTSREGAAVMMGFPMNQAVRLPTQSVTRSSAGVIERAAPYVLSLMRIMVALLFVEHGMSRLFAFPSPMPTPPMLTLYWFAGCIELIGGILVTLGLFTRPAAFVMSGEMAVAYFHSHAPRGFFPILNHGDGAVLFCFVFLYLAFAGGGPLSLDALLTRNKRG
jgi:putative oxidoreductase